VTLDLTIMDDVRDEVARAGILVQIGFQRRFDAGYEAARDAVASGAVGWILVMRAATHDPVSPPAEYIAASGGIFADLHIHDFDAVRFVSGEEITEVYADGAALAVDGRARRCRRLGRRSAPVGRRARDPLRDPPRPARLRRAPRGSAVR